MLLVAIILGFIGGIVASVILISMLPIFVRNQENLEMELVLVINHIFVLLLTSNLGIVIGWFVGYLFYLLFNS